MCYFHEHFLGLAPLEVGLMTLEANWTPPTFTIKPELLFPFTKREYVIDRCTMFCKSLITFDCQVFGIVQFFQFGMLNFSWLLDLLRSSL